MKLQPALSAYLDFMRFVAALAVMLSHLDADGTSIGWLPLTHLGHEAVIVFFVLSGFIIHHSTTARQSTTASMYVAARLSRIYSVALPAIVLCTGLTLLISHFAPDLGAKMASNKPFNWSDAFSSVLFLNESWGNAAELSLNGPYWSLCYEVWFYVMFGAFIFARGRMRLALLAGAALIAGPAVLALLPVWIMGAWLSANGGWERQWHPAFAWAGFLLPWVVIGIFSSFGVHFWVTDWLTHNVPGFWRLGMSKHVLTDYFYGLLVVIHIRSFASLPMGFQTAFQRMGKQLAYLAGFSFTIYLFHFPMTRFVGAVAPSPEGEVLYPLAVALAIVVICWLISFGTERQLPAWRRLFTRWIGAFSSGGIFRSRAS